MFGLCVFHVKITCVYFKRFVDAILPILGLKQADFCVNAMLPHTSVLLNEEKENIVENFMIVEYARKVPLIVNPQGESSFCWKI